MAEESVAGQKEQKKRRKKVKVFVASGKRKRAVARASITKGSGRVFFNGKPLSLLSNPLAREVLYEPLLFVSASEYDVKVNAAGGGTMGQAQAGRTAIAKALVGLTGDADLKKKFIAFDRSLVVDDPRRVEPKKFKGPKARARFTKSYR